nr:MAG TPA: hypothetical protein [Caudoviricetes sp.]
MTILAIISHCSIHPSSLSSHSISNTLSFFIFSSYYFNIN